MKAKMVVGILARSMILNGILSKEPTKQVANDEAVLKLKTDSQHRTISHKTHSLTVAY
ncbi:hypothetical protein A79_2072 [Vibrio parahaemolyticus AQ3810]|uniref:hypothetical protein n=1 Tax=Vibrio parahaemolyticus TaxID=670 RepID=UPI0001565100|nr:hypothetical protein [Vibrio parahaemolyticus]EDM57648.1 hypothetical protein A79_2072 [Vibrio parahaemolyticus AQ3810]EXF69200.1 hypothetical protein D030_3197 [Vibrio parahaemolyticus AQ3810]